MKYFVRGKIRGTVSKHKTLYAAIKSLRRDQEGCRRQGGYSDCKITDADGRPLLWEEMLEILRKEYHHEMGR
jgi:hypothetical protein